MAEYNIIIAAEEEMVAVISDSEEEEDNDDGIVEIFDGSPQSPSLTLPPEVWGIVINYLPYDSLISCASTSRAMLNDALPLVTTLHIEKSSQLRIGLVSNHLRDVRSVSIYNLFSLPITGDIELNEDIAKKSVKFIIASKFPHLESIDFWGKSENRLHSLNMSFTSIHNDQKGSIHNLMDSFSGAFDCGSLPPNLRIVGLRCPRKRRSGNSDCRSCIKVCKMFPLELIGDVDLCIPTARSNEIIMSREGGREYLHSETRLLQLLGKCRVIPASRGDCYIIIKYSSRVKAELKSMVETSQVNINKLNPQDVVLAIKKRYPINVTVYFSEISFDYLKTTVGVSISDNLLDPGAIRVENVDRMVKHITEETSSLQKSIDQLRRLLSKKQDSPNQRVIESGVLPKVVEFLRRDDDCKLQFAASEIMLHLAGGTSEHNEEVVKIGSYSTFSPPAELSG